MTKEEAREHCEENPGDWVGIDYESPGHPHVAVDKDGSEHIFREKPVREENIWSNTLIDLDEDNIIQGIECVDCIPLPKGTIEKILDRKLTWEDEPVELKL